MWNVEKVPFTSVDAVCGANVTINVGKTNPFYYHNRTGIALRK